MHIGQNQAPATIKINNDTVDVVSSFVYLGSTLSRTGDISMEINRRRGLAAGVMRALRKPLWRHRCISRRTKLRIYNAAVLSVLLYGAETWVLTRTLAQRFHGFDSRPLRKIEGIHWTERVTNEEIRERTSQPPVLQL